MKKFIIVTSAILVSILLTFSVLACFIDTSTPPNNTIGALWTLFSAILWFPWVKPLVIATPLLIIAVYIFFCAMDFKSCHKWEKERSELEAQTATLKSQLAERENSAESED